MEEYIFSIHTKKKTIEIELHDMESQKRPPKFLSVQKYSINDEDLCICSIPKAFIDENCKIEINKISKKREHVSGNRYCIKHTNDKTKYGENGCRMFDGIYGYAQIEIQTNERSCISDYIPIECSNKQIKDRVERMVQFLLNYDNIYLLRTYSSDKVLVGDSSDNVRNIFNFIGEVVETIEVYQKNLLFYQENAESRDTTVSRIDKFEKVNQLNNHTMEYILRNPQELFQENKGILINGNTYMPHKTLLQASQRSHDMYENQMVVCFLKFVMERLSKEIALLSDSEQKYSGYLELYYRLIREKLLNYKDQIGRLFYCYKNAHYIDTNTNNNRLTVTRIFCEVPQYKAFYACMKKWYYGSNLSFSGGNQELYLRGPMQFPKDCDVYEIFVIAKLYEYFAENGYSLERQASVNNKNKKALNEYYCFTKEEEKIEIFYEPTICKKSEQSLQDADYEYDLGIFLKTDTYLKPEMGREGDILYDIKRIQGGITPDYIIKYTVGEKSRYIIADAKFGYYDAVVNERMPECIMKYLTTTDVYDIDSDKIVGLILFAGKDDFNNSKADFEFSQFNSPVFTKIIRLDPYTNAEESLREVERLIRGNE